MQTFQDAIQSVKKSQDYPNTLDAIIAYLFNERGEVDRSIVDQLIKDLSGIVTSNKFQPITKFYAVMIAKDITLQKIGGFIAALASSTLLQEMVRLAKEVDPKKKMAQKGLKLFSGNPELGNRYMTLILQCIVVWEMKFPTTQKKTPTKFRIYGEDVRSSGVVLPKQFVYFDLQPKPPKNPPSQTPQPPKQNQYDKSPEAHLKHSLSKIQGLAATLSSSVQTEDTQREIIKFHRFFVDDAKRVQANFNNYLENMKQDDINLLMELNNFYCQEQKIFKATLEGSKDLNDIQKYRDLLQPSISLLYPYFSNKQQKRQQRQQQNEPRESKERRQSKQPRESKEPRDNTQKPKSDIRNSKPQIKRTDSLQRRQEQVQSPIERIQQKPKKSQSNIRRSSIEQNVQSSELKQLERDAQEAEQNLRQMFAASSSVHMGFNQLKNILASQKNQIASHGSRFYQRDRSRTPVEEYRSRSRHDMTNQSMSQSKVSVFELFPDVKVSRTDYLGTTIPKQSSLYTQLNEVSEAQGPRRFKCSNFKAKSILFQNDQLQIGFKSSAHYEEVPPYKAFLQISMFFGNKSEDTITHFGAQFQGDRNCIIYANPSKAQPTIQGCYQSKQQLLVIPLALPFSLVTLKMKYTINRQITRANIALPVTILKFTQFQRIDSNAFRSQYNDLRNSVIKTEPFYLSHSMPPATVKRYLSELTEITDYQQFITQKSYMEYKLCVKALVLNQYDCLIKLRVRPNMTVVVQVTPCQPNVKHSKTVATFLLQTLRFVLEKQN